MPSFDYRCPNCDTAVTLFGVHVDWRDRQRCTTCWGWLTRLVASPAIQFVGSGWTEKGNK